jgi:hypothetical protein
MGSFPGGIDFISRDLWDIAKDRKARNPLSTQNKGGTRPCFALIEGFVKKVCSSICDFQNDA